jgi:hypothetical protein
LRLALQVHVIARVSLDSLGQTRRRRAEFGPDRGETGERDAGMRKQLEAVRRCPSWFKRDRADEPRSE